MNVKRTVAAKHNLILLFMVVLPLVSVAIGVLYILHTPHPSVKAPVAIDRNSLLPHLYAGPCINCHQIVERGPVRLSWANMDRFRLSEVDRKLLIAGQRVEVATLGQTLRIPAITRSDTLPHDYVGVCSNCHLVLDVRPSVPYMQEAMARAGQHLLALDLSAADIARGGMDADASRPRSRILWGYAAIPLFLLTSVFVMLRFVQGAAGAPAGSLGWWRTIHPWAGGAFSGAALMHFYYSDKGNNFLHLALVTVVALTLGGCVLLIQSLTLPSRPGGLLHLGQRSLFVALIALLILGHLVAQIG